MFHDRIPKSRTSAMLVFGICYFFFGLANVQASIWVPSDHGVGSSELSVSETPAKDSMQTDSSNTDHHPVPVVDELPNDHATDYGESDEGVTASNPSFQIQEQDSFGVTKLLSVRICELSFLHIPDSPANQLLRPPQRI